MGSYRMGNGLFTSNSLRGPLPGQAPCVPGWLWPHSIAAAVPAPWRAGPSRGHTWGDSAYLDPTWAR